MTKIMVCLLVDKPLQKTTRKNGYRLFRVNYKNSLFLNVNSWELHV